MMSRKGKHDYSGVAEDYLNGINPVALSARHNIPLSSIKYYLYAQKLPQKRREMTRKVINKTAKKVEKQKNDKMDKLLQMSDRLDDLLLAFTQKEGEPSNGYAVIPPMQAKEVQALTRALKDAVDVKQELNGIVSTVERERLELERERLSIAKDKDTAEPTRFELSAEAEEYAE